MAATCLSSSSSKCKCSLSSFLTSSSNTSSSTEAEEDTTEKKGSNPFSSSFIEMRLRGAGGGKLAQPRGGLCVWGALFTRTAERQQTRPVFLSLGEGVEKLTRGPSLDRGRRTNVENLKVSRVFLRTRQRFSRKPKDFVFFLFFAHFLA